MQVALGQLAGGLAHPLQRLRDALLDLLAHVEAGFDFADEDLPFITREELDRQLAEAESSVAAILAQMISRSEPVDAVQAVLVGRPNTGKSSLFNALAGKHAALVSDHPGTTRDYLVAELDLDGVKCRLIDTAGTRAGDEGQRRAARECQRMILNARRNRPPPCNAGSRDVEVLCLDATRRSTSGNKTSWPAGRPRADRRADQVRCAAPLRLFIPQPSKPAASPARESTHCERALRRAVLDTGDGHGDVVAGTAVRCCESLRLADECLHRARQLAAAAQEELAAAEIRLALDELGKVVGAVYTEDVLDRIFSRFCIGK